MRALLICVATLIPLPALARPAITPAQARQLLAMSGANVGTIRHLDGIGNVRIDDIKVGSDGPWIVIRVRPEVVR